MQVDREAWDLEYQQVVPRLQIRVAADARDWRSHLDTAAEHLRRAFPLAAERKGAGDAPMSAWPQTKRFLAQVQAEVGEHMDRISFREQFLNNELAQEVTEYRTRKLEHEQRQVSLLAISFCPMTMTIVDLQVEVQCLLPGAPLAVVTKRCMSRPHCRAARRLSLHLWLCTKGCILQADAVLLTALSSAGRAREATSGSG